MDGSSRARISYMFVCLCSLETTVDPFSYLNGLFGCRPTNVHERTEVAAKGETRLRICLGLGVAPGNMLGLSCACRG